MNTELNRHHIHVIGHQHPDTDSICAAITYANLKNQIEGKSVCVPCRAGNLNRETEFVLDHFKVPVPRLLMDVSPQIRDIDIREIDGVNGEMTLRRAWMAMRDEKIDTLCVLDEEKHLQGVITVKDIATANMDSLDPYVLSKTHTSYKNIMETLDAAVVVGSVEDKFAEGRIIIGSGNAEAVERAVSKGDIVIVANRSESQLAAIEMEAGCIIVCANAKLSRTVCMLAEEKDVVVLTTPNSTYVAGQMISQAAPIGFYMTKEGLLNFTPDTSVEQASKIMASVRYRYFPVLDADGHYMGVVSRRNMMNLHRKQVIMVDHNEMSQAVEGMNEAEIEEIIDHHRIGGTVTDGPVHFRNEPVGCTCTIIYAMYQENNIKPDKKMAGLMLSAILSDTLMFRSPTCTMLDKNAAKELAEIAGVEIEEYGDAMFGAGGDVTGKSAEDIFNADYKVFGTGDIQFGVGQGSYMTAKNRKASEKLVGPYLPTAREKQGLRFVFYMFTDVRSSTTELLMDGADADKVIKKAFNVEVTDGMAVLPGVVSRKKQMIPALLAAIKELASENELA